MPPAQPQADDANVRSTRRFPHVRGIVGRFRKSPPNLWILWKTQDTILVEPVDNYRRRVVPARGALLESARLGMRASRQPVFLEIARLVLNIDRSSPQSGWPLCGFLSGLRPPFLRRPEALQRICRPSTKREPCATSLSTAMESRLCSDGWKEAPLGAAGADSFLSFPQLWKALWMKAKSPHRGRSQASGWLEYRR